MDIHIMTVKGVAGPSVYVNDFRVAGPKPWGGGSAINEFHTTLEFFNMAVGGRRFREKNQEIADLKARVQQLEAELETKEGKK